MAKLRVRDLNRLLQARHGYKLPDNAQGRQFAHVMVHHLARLQGFDVFQRLPSWCRLYAPFLSDLDVAELAAEALKTPKYWRAAALGWHLKLTTLERSASRITTIAAYDRTLEERAADKKRLARERKRLQRQSKPRAEYLAEAVKPKPWLALGISRRTYFRQKKKLAQSLP